MGEQIILSRARVFGIPVPIPKSFSCVLEGHDHQARLWFWRDGAHWLYQCPGLESSVGLAQLRAFVAYGAQRHLSDVEAARWGERLDYDAGLLSPVELDVRLPEKCAPNADRVAMGMHTLVALRSERFPLDEPFPFAFEFAPAYCGLSVDQTRDGKRWLARAGVAYRAGKHGRMDLWKLTAQDAFVAQLSEGGR